VVTLDTKDLSTATKFAVCYSEGDGTLNATWVDSGIRLTVSKITYLNYGWPVRSIYSTSAITSDSKIPLGSTAAFYHGDLPNFKYLSIVSSELNNGNPCIYPDTAAASADAYRSGVSWSSTGTKQITFDTSAFDSSTVYTVCYSEISGATTDSTWRDSYIRFRLTKMESTEARGAVATTFGHLPRTSVCSITYAGALANNVWVSLVDETLNADFPCADSTVAAGADSQHSGAAQGSSSVVTYDTTVLSTSKTFAVCYTEGDGTASASWVDTAIRLTVSKLWTIEYGYPTRVLTVNLQSFSLLPRTPESVTFTYQGTLPTGSYVALIDSTMNSNLPCQVQGVIDSMGSPTLYGSAATGAIDAYRSGSMRAATGTSTIVLPAAAGTVLAEDATFTLCYAESPNETEWRNSFVYARLTKLRTLMAHSVSHTTSGHIANVWRAPCLECFAVCHHTCYSVATSICRQFVGQQLGFASGSNYQFQLPLCK